MATPKNQPKQVAPKPAPKVGLNILMSITPALPTAANYSVENGQIWVEATLGTGLLYGVYAIAYSHPGAAPEPDQQLDWLGGSKYGAWISYPSGQIRVNYRADFEDTNDPAAPPITVYALSEVLTPT